MVASNLDKDAPLWGSLLVGMREARERVRRELVAGRIMSPPKPKKERQRHEDCTRAGWASQQRW